MILTLAAQLLILASNAVAAVTAVTAAAAPNCSDGNFNCSSPCLRSLVSTDHRLLTLRASGLVLNSLGDFSACTQTNSSHHMCVLSAHVGGAEFTQGLCLSTDCSSDGLESAFSYASDCPQEFNATLHRCLAQACQGSAIPASVCSVVADAAATFVKEVDVTEAHCGSAGPKDTDSLTAGAWTMLIVISIIFTAILTQSLIEYASSRRTSSILLDGSNIQDSDMMGDYSSKSSSSKDASKPSPRRGVAAILGCFSVAENMTELLSRSPARTLRPLDALRAISMFWIILGHSIIFQNTPEVGYANVITATQDVLQGFSSQFLVAIPFTVDTFFFLSGLLTAYVVARKSIKAAREGGRFRLPIVLGVVFRWLRLAPMVAFVVGVYSTLIVYAGDGPLWFRFVNELSVCPSYWWTNVLFVNNFYPTNYKDQCIPWAWYLANDFQFFVIGMLVLKLYSIGWRRGAWISTLLLLACGIISPGVISNDLHLNLAVDIQNTMYDKPYARIAPFAVGMITAFVIAERLEQLRRAPFWAVHASMCVGIAGLLAIQYVTYDFNFNGKHPNWSQAASSTYFAFTKVAWGAGCALLVVGCVSGHGGIVNWFLCLPFWEVFGKLTFAAYLVHPALMRMVYYQARDLYYFTYTGAVFNHFSYILSAYGLATILYVCVELPMGNLVGLLRAKRR